MAKNITQILQKKMPLMVFQNVNQYKSKELKSPRT